jgi:hypothetical protein
MTEPEPTNEQIMDAITRIAVRAQRIEEDLFLMRGDLAALSSFVPCPDLRHGTSSSETCMQTEVEVSS